MKAHTTAHVTSIERLRANNAAAREWIREVLSDGKQHRWDYLMWRVNEPGKYMFNSSNLHYALWSLINAGEVDTDLKGHVWKK